MTTISRKNFLKLSAAFVGSAALLPGCSGDDDEDTGAGTDTTSTSSGSTSGSTSGTPTGTSDSDATTDASTTTGSSTSTSGSTGSTSGSTGSSSGGSTGSGTSGATGVLGCDSDVDGAIGTNHGHSLTVPLADIEAGAEKSYDIQGGSQHPHTVTVTAQDFADLKMGLPVVITSSTGNAHTHAVTLMC